jgi:TPR repeat protein
MRLYQLIADVWPEAQTEIGWLYQNALGVAQDFAQAAEWYKRASAEGNTNADRLLGVLYLHGAGVEKEFGQARAHLVRAAEAGDAEAMRIVGTMDESGQGIASPDYAEAMRWYINAAEAGNPAALFNQSKLYQDGLGVPQDHAKAIELLEQAAAKGHLMSMTTLGVYHEQGVGVPKDFAKALEYYERAAAQGDADAAYFAAALYDQGLGVARDVDKARQFYQQAADAGNEPAKQALVVLIQQDAKAVIDEATELFIADCDRYAADPADRDRPAEVPGVAPTEMEADPAISNCQGAVKLAPQLARAHYQLGRAQQAKGEFPQAAAAYEAAAGLGSSIAALNVGRMYHKGEGVAPNVEKARTYYEQAVAAGEAGAEEALAALNAEEPAILERQVADDMPQQGENAGADCDRLAADPNDPTRPADVAGVAITKINVDEAQPPCEMAAELVPDDARRVYQLGRVYYASGAFDKAFSTLNSAAAMGSPGAILGVGDMYQNGEGVAPDPQQARQHYERAAEAGHVEAMVRLARLYLRGDGVPRDPRRARELMLQAQQAQKQR